jgi:ankyrin repeat protein
LSKKGYNPVHYAAYYGNLDMLKLLLSYCPDTNIKNKYGENVQEIAKKKLEASQYSEIEDFFEFNAVK